MADFHVDIVPADQLRTFESSYFTEMECSGAASTPTQFNYAFGLVHAQRREDIRKSIPLLQSLLRPGTDHRDFIYYLSLAYYRLGEHDKALAYVKRVLAMEPNNKQAQNLHDSIQKTLKTEGALGMAIVTGGVAIGVGLVAIVAGALIRR
ncbi:mitochondrial fission 1 protein-like [Sycon ciliatum]|uniref:mitochondrial fission 1 protein-like n=1 Tax=Sycon ciliatum TaxID=27933 RepID=UPI0020AB506D|eukprot:scpid49695/ scgid27269/ Mitochondrial fission 1 protein; FIS1 homolog; Tetratricopeptide repeat protein 11